MESAPRLRRTTRTATVVAVGLTALGLGAVGSSAALASQAPSKPVTLKSGTLGIQLRSTVYAALTDSSSSSTSSTDVTRTVSPLAPGLAPVAGRFSLPISGGTLNLAALTGTVRSRGGIEFTRTDSNQQTLVQSETEFTLKSFALRLSDSPAEVTASFVGKQNVSNAPIFLLTTTHARHSKHGKSVSISGLTIQLTGDGAYLFNSQASGFRVGQTVGTASLSGTT